MMAFSEALLPGETLRQARIQNPQPLFDIVSEAIFPDQGCPLDRFGFYDSAMP
jgi:hypothetical protein